MLHAVLHQIAYLHGIVLSACIGLLLSVAGQ